MPDFPANLLARWAGGRWTVEPSRPVAGFCVDSRRLRAGELFVAIKTGKRDGHDFLPAAQAAGAAAALVAVPSRGLALPQLVVADPVAAFQAIAREHRRRFTGPVVGISGSAGKTSTKELVALILGGEEEGVLATEGNLNNHLGVPLTLTRIDPGRHRFAVVEAGIGGPGEMRPLAEMIEPDVALITLVAPAHTEALDGLEGVAREKAILPALARPNGLAIFSRATAGFSAFRDLNVRAMIVERADVVRPSEPPKDRVYFAVSNRGDRSAVSISYGPPPPLLFHFRRVTDGMAHNAAFAICIGLWLGVPPRTIQERLDAWKPARLRGEIRYEEGRMLYLDCYNANPASMSDALDAFDSMAQAGEPRLYVLGCMEELGRDAAALHRALGRRLLVRDGDQLFVIGTHAAEVCAGVLENGDRSRQLQIVGTLEPVAACLAEWRGAVFVKGSRRYALERALEGPAAAKLKC